MTDKRLAELAKRFKEADIAAKAAKEVKDDLGKKLVAEMNRRGTKVIEREGIRLNIVTPETTTYDPAMLPKLPVELRREVTKRVIDTDALSQAVQAGKIPMRLLNKYSTVTPKASYPLVTIL